MSQYPRARDSLLRSATAVPGVSNVHHHDEVGAAIEEAARCARQPPHPAPPRHRLSFSPLAVLCCPAEPQPSSKPLQARVTRDRAFRRFDHLLDDLHGHRNRNMHLGTNKRTGPFWTGPFSCCQPPDRQASRIRTLLEVAEET